MTSPDGCGTLHQRIRGALLDDPVLASLGLGHRTIGAEPPSDRPGLRIAWSDDWAFTSTGLAGTLTVEPTGMTAGTRAAVLDRVGTVLADAHGPGGPLRVRRSGTAGGSFLVLAHSAEARVPAG